MPPVFEMAVPFLLGYLIGSIPTSYLTARWVKGIDIRQYGSGSLGGANLHRSVGGWAAVLVGLIDIAKAALTVLTVQRLGGDLSSIVIAGLAVVLGHNWGVFLRFYGGRGISPTMGMLLPLAPKVLLANALIALGLLVYYRSSPVPAAVALIFLPVSSLLLGYPAPITWGCLGLVFIAFAKRLTANGKPQGEPTPWARVLLYRFLYDRDTKDREAWLARRPPEAKEG